MLHDVDLHVSVHHGFFNFFGQSCRLQKAEVALLLQLHFGNQVFALLCAWLVSLAQVLLPLGLALAAGVAGRIGYRAFAREPGWIDSDAAPYWREMRRLGIWATIGAVIFWLFSQSYNYILAARVDLTAVADVNASRMLLMPAMLLTTGVRSLLGPMSTTWLTQFGLDRLLKRLLVFIVGLAVLQLMYFAFLWFFRDWLTADLMHRTIGNRDMLLLAWSGVTLVALTREVLQCATQAMLRFEASAYITAVEAAKRNNDTAIAYLRQLQELYDSNQLSGDINPVNAVAAEARAYGPVAAAAFNAQSMLVNAFSSLMAVPIAACEAPRQP